MCVVELTMVNRDTHNAAGVLLQQRSGGHPFWVVKHKKVNKWNKTTNSGTATRKQAQKMPWLRGRILELLQILQKTG